MKKLIACLLVLSMLLGGMMLAIGAAGEDESEPERLPAEYGPVTKEDQQNGVVAEYKPRCTIRQIVDNL